MQNETPTLAEVKLQPLESSLRERARHHRRMAWGSMIFAALLLLIAVCVFVFAGSLPESSSVIQDYAATGRLLKTNLESFAISGPHELTDTGDPVFARDGQAIHELTANWLKETDKFVQLLQLNPDDSMYRMISLVVVRIGTLLLVGFLVRLLVALYRYESRMATFYDGRADLISVWREDASPGFVDLAKAFSADHIDYGVPRAPIDDVLRLMHVMTKATKASV